ncbi:MAG: albusnodin family lasso peptide [Pseudonocardiaceae bacterium]
MRQTADDMVPEVPTVEPRVQLGDAVELTLGEGSGTSEDKRYQYN